MRDDVLMADSFSSILYKRQSSNAPAMPTQRRNKNRRS
jgi:hypothetical protein